LGIDFGKKDEDKSCITKITFNPDGTKSIGKEIVFNPQLKRR